MRHTLAASIVLASILSAFVARAQEPVCTVRPLGPGSWVRTCESAPLPAPNPWR